MRPVQHTSSHRRFHVPCDSGHRTINVVQPNQPGDQDRYREVQLALATAARITIVCGAGISTRAGIPDFRSASGLYNCKLPGLDSTILGTELFDSRALLDRQKLLASGRAMGALRTLARKAQPTACHEYIVKLHHAGRLLRCYTQNVDGLQTRGRSDMDKVVLELHGSLERLKCSRCGQSTDRNAEDIDELMLRDGFVECQKCGKRGTANGPNVKWDLRPLPPGILLPQVLHNESSREIECNGMGLDELERADGRANLLLVIGTSLKTNGAATLVKSLARKVRGSGGMVAYVNREKLPDRPWADYFDVHLMTEIDPWALDASYNLDTVSACDSNRGQVEALTNMKGFHVQKNQPLLDSNQSSYLAIQAQRVRGPEQTEARVTTTAGPHARVSKLLFLVCHSGALSSLARSIALQLVNQGQDRGCICRGYVISISGPDEISPKLLKWTQYHLVVLHLSDYLLRLYSPWRCIEPGQGTGELLNRAVYMIRGMLAQSQRSLLVVLCAEDELLDEGQTSSLEESFRKQSAFDIMVTNLNLCRFRPGSWAKLVVDIMVPHDESEPDVVEQVCAEWMLSEELFTTSDLVILSRHAPTTMLLASIFPERPMGKPLPGIEDTCCCSSPNPEMVRKVWEVHHNAANGCAAKDVKITLRCSLCQQAWDLETASLLGIIRFVGDRSCVQVKYTMDQGWV